MNAQAPGTISSQIRFHVMMPTSPVLLYDSRCGVCRRFVRFLVRKDRGGTVRIAPLQGELGAGVRAYFPQFEERDSAVWLPLSGRPSGYSEAILDSLEYVGGGWSIMSRAGRLVPRRVRDGMYRMFARNRRYFGWLGIPDLGEEAKARLISGATQPDASAGV